MKKITFFVIGLLYFGCQKSEPKSHGFTIKDNPSLIDPKNPLNKLTYTNKIDFYCKMDITKFGVADTATYKGKLYGFCAPLCKEEFIKNPELYLAKK
ncbi:YHS domain-containing protein [Flavobacterium sp.]|uniref:YHS domain-containing protein n=1 Tax=Flavobacterium sp. TaxID=239 RepID=UPI003340F9BE